VLFCEAFGKELFVKAFFDEVVVRIALGSEDRPAVVHEGKDYRRIETLILGLDMISYAAEFDVCIVPGYHVSKGEDLRAVKVAVKPAKRHSEVNIPRQFRSMIS